MSWVLSKKDLLSAVQAQVLKEGAESFSGVSIDSRTVQKGNLFFALKGPSFDGHDFLKSAFENGAVGFVIDDKSRSQDFLKSLPEKVLVLQVKSSLKALQDLACFWKKHLNIQVIGITGSNGKTTTKEFAKTLMTSLLVKANPKSYNNEIGVPLSLLKIDKKTNVLL
ncbi:MAG: Mur ligase domain-containing protein, partial [Bdellovibrionales bacterium]